MPADFYRENPARSIHVLGLITPELMTRLMPDITRLRATPGTPVTVYIDSPGGSTYVMDALVALLRTPDHDGRECPLTTVVTHRAASAAADLLISGDYAIAFPDAIVHYHGTRSSADGVTVEDAHQMAGNLQSANERFALRLAQRIVSRLLFLLTIHRHEIDADPREVNLSSPAAVLTELMCRRLAEISPVFSAWVEEARRHQLETAGLVRALISEVFPKDAPAGAEQEPWVEVEIRLVKALLDYERKRPNRPGEWSLSEAGWDELRRHFFQVIDFFGGEHRRHQARLVAEHGAIMLSKDELEDYKARRADPAAAEAWLKEKSGSRMSEFWYFVICLCRRLQTGENRMPAAAAYWLGLVDEVLGSDLPCMRMILESRTPPPPASTADALS